ncbi:hypothetical protein [Virgibacillus sp. MSP4-1]|uniref:hypothetical protein n=1 Tax=Virgibacillus sp. MSP4-1 TaxID=2700081 RepID=UPI0003A9CB22|nr:hypothetical protein [Virgibacillus sp. MSP4-1]
MSFYYNPEVKFLLMKKSHETAEVLYDENQRAFKLPQTGPRPPYYANPRYEPYYPVI